VNGYVIGLSGGLDSAVAAALMSQKGEVYGVLMPTKATPQRDIEDAITLADQLGITYSIIPIDEIVAKFPGSYDPKVRGNIAARVRMTVLYTLANESDLLVVGTSDKSEYELGFFTKWGDGAADIYPIIHLYKTEVRQLAKELGIPKSIIDKPSSPALIEGQTAEGEIGFSYDEIDSMLKGEKPMHPELQKRIEANRHKQVLVPKTEKGEL